MNGIETHVSGDQNHILLCVQTLENLMCKINQKMHFWTCNSADSLQYFNFKTFLPLKTNFRDQKRNKYVGVEVYVNDLSSQATDIFVIKFSKMP